MLFVARQSRDFALLWGLFQAGFDGAGFTAAGFFDQAGQFSTQAARRVLLNLARLDIYGTGRLTVRFGACPSLLASFC